MMEREIAADLVPTLGSVNIDIQIAVRQPLQPVLQPLERPCHTESQDECETEKGNPDRHAHQRDGDHLVDDEAIDLACDISGNERRRGVGISDFPIKAWRKVKNAKPVPPIMMAAAVTTIATKRPGIDNVTANPVSLGNAF